MAASPGCGSCATERFHLASGGAPAHLQALKRQEPTMLLTALTLAAAVGAAPPAIAERMPNLFHQPARCGATYDEVLRRIRTSFKDRPGFQYAVHRTVDGCGVAAPVGYHPDYLLPGHADAPRFRPVDDPEPPKP
jgi:hypothetical protein